MRASKLKIKHRFIVIGFLILVLSVIYTSNFISDSNNIIRNRNENFDLDNSLKVQDLTSENILSGISSAWNLTHWANRTNNDLAVSFAEGASGTSEIPLGSGWKGYKLSADIKDLTDERNWINGTFIYGVDDGSAAAGENDTTWIQNNYQNWTFQVSDTGYGTNPMSGNYQSNIDGQDCLELRMDDDTTILTGYSTYDPDDKCWWSSSIQIPRGNLIDSSLAFDLYPEHLAHFNSWAFSIYLNSRRVYSIGTYTLKQFGEDSWHSFVIPQNVWSNTSNVFPNEPLDNSLLDIDLVLECIGGGNFSGFPDDDYQRIYVDNVELVVNAEVLPSDIGLRLNQTIVQDIDWGQGSVEINGDWESANIIANFTSIDAGELGSYDITLDSNLNLFAIKHSPETNYETDVISLGTMFSVNNASAVNWESYGFVAIPTGYSESIMRLDFPTDIVISAVFEPENPSFNILGLCDDSVPGRLIIPVNTFSLNPDGFWKFEATSPNYCEDLTFYNNATGEWVENDIFLSGEQINITANILNSMEVSSYIQYTNALLQIRFPNGSLWTELSQYASVDSNGNVAFSSFQIPSKSPFYEVGEYEAIVSWNNSFSSYGFNESGIIYKNFYVKHFSNLIPDVSYYKDIIDGSILNLRVTFSDFENFDAIENANIYTRNYTHPSYLQYFGEISPGYYLLEFNITGAPNAGNNTLTLYANSPNFVNSETNITIDIIKNTVLTVNSDYLTGVPIEQNFTIQFNYTEIYSGVGISTNNLSTNWAGEYQFATIAQGVYTLTCNASGPGYQADNLYSMILTVEANRYQPQSIPIRIFITEKASFLELYINGTKKLEDEVVTIEFWQKLNVTVYYHDASSNHLGGASIRLTGVGISESLNEDLLNYQYSYILNGSDLGLGIKYLSILANVSNFNPQSIRFITEVIERRTLLEIYLNGENKTSNPSLDIAINKLLNITIKYTDINGNHIEDATVNMFGAISTSLIENKLLQHYSYVLNTSFLDIGVRIIAVSAEKTNHIFQTEDIRIEVRRIHTNITTQDGITVISVLPGNDVTLKIVLHDLDFGGTINGAIVSYSGLGSGLLTDDNNDGVYEVVFRNIVEGTYKIVIGAFLGDNYEFKSFEVTISAIRPPGEALLIIVLAIAISAAALVILGYIYAYQKFLKYPKPVRKVRKYQKTLEKAKNPKINIVNRKNAFNSEYEAELNKISKLTKTKAVEPPVTPQKIQKKPIENLDS